MWEGGNYGVEWLFAFLMIVASTFQIWTEDVKITVMDRSYRTVEFALEHAVHDATLQVDDAGVSEGKILFNEVEAERVLRQTISKNLPVDSLLRPTSSAFMEEPMLIQDVFYIDEDYKDPRTGKTVQFPLNWEYTLPNGKVFQRVIYGASIVLVVDVSVKGGDGYNTFINVQEYKKKF